jgi:cytochrome P450
VYRALRDEAPLHRSPSGVYCLSRFDDVSWALKQVELFSSAGAFEVAMLEKARKNVGVKDVVELVRFMLRSRINPFTAFKSRPENLITSDPPRHDVLRSIVNRGFTPRRIQPLEQRMREIVAGCMERLQRGEVFDVVHDLAIPLPVTVIAELLGVDPADRDRFKGWSDAIIAGSSGSQRGVFGPFMRAMGELNAYMGPIVQARREAPADDLVSVLVGGSPEESLEDPAILGFIVLLLVAGNETTTNLIGNGTLALLDHPAELERVREDVSLVPGMIEEMIRFDSPVQFVLRRATRDIERHGQTIPAESIVALMLSAANRDERRFEDPDRFDVTRETKGHLGFGFGVHFCLGASLARLEAKVAFEALVPELPRLERTGRETGYIDSYLVRGPREIELSVVSGDGQPVPSQ